MIRSYGDFVNALLEAGFSMGGGNSEGIYSVVSWSWDEEPPYDTPVRWHTGDPETDPWEWRMRALDERNDIAYGKLLFRKSGYITKEWYPYFLAVRRAGRSLAEAYADGTVSHTAKRVYGIVSEYGTLPVHAIKQLGGFGKEDVSGFDWALTELQMKMYLTICGRQQKLSRKGEEYGWSSTVFCTVEDFWGMDMLERAASIPPSEAEARIAEQVRRLNPAAEAKRIAKFIRG